MRGAAALIAIALCALHARAQLPPAPADAELSVQSSGDELVLNFRDAELPAVVAAIAQQTGRRFIHDETLRGRITLLTFEPVSADEALELLNASLLLIGFAAIPGPDGAHKILPIQAAKGAAPWLQGPATSESERMVTTIVRLEAADPVELAAILGREDRSSIIVPYPRSRSLIIAAAEDRIASMVTLLRALDHASKSELRVIPLRYAQAAETATQLQELFTPEGAAPELPFRLVVDERTNSLIVIGAPARVAEIRDFVERFDVPARSPTGFHVVRIANADAETLATQLGALEFSASKGLERESYDVIADAPTNSLVIRAPPAVFAELAQVIGELDRIPARVGIEVYVWDVESSPGMDLGWNALIPLVNFEEFGDTLAAVALGDVTTLDGDIDPGQFITRFTRFPILIPVTDPNGVPIDVLVPQGGGSITAAASDTQLDLLTSPYLLTASGEEQHIFAGEQVPIPVSSGSAGSVAEATPDGDGVTSATDPFQTSLDIAREEVGVDLTITPKAVSDDVITLELRIEVTSVSETASETLGPTIRKYSAETSVRLVDGAVVLVASAPADVQNIRDTGVPWLKDIPILGWLFRTESIRERRRRLVTAVQATAIHSPEEQRAQAIVRRVAFERHADRTGGLADLTIQPYALHVATRATPEEAQSVAAELAAFPGRPVILPWTSDGVTQYDVYQVDFPELADLAPVSVEIRKLGFITRLEMVRTTRG